MKRIVLVAFLSGLTVTGFSQMNMNQQIDPIGGRNVLIGLYAGAGCATSNNYDVGPSAGLDFTKEIGFRSSIGANLFYQGYSLYYDNEANSAKHGTGIAGAILRETTSYVFVTPKYEYGFGKRQKLHAYLTIGAGFKISGFDSLRKWDHSFKNPGVNNYDSSLDLSKNINSMMLRVGVGLKQYMYIGMHWRFTIIEDFGFLPSSLTKTGNPDDPTRTQYSPHKLNPAYISVQIGICHTKLSYYRHGPQYQ